MTDTPTPRLRTEPVPFFDLVEQHRAMAADVQAAVDRVVSSQKFILGEEVAALETETAQYCDALHAIGCASGSPNRVSIVVTGVPMPASLVSPIVHRYRPRRPPKLSIPG